MKYSEYLQTTYWKQRRETFRQKTHNRCYICRAKNTELHTHHKRYTRNGRSILFNELHTDFRLLCKNCHYKLHKYKLEKCLINGTKRTLLRDTLKKLRL